MNLKNRVDLHNFNKQNTKLRCHQLLKLCLENKYVKLMISSSIFGKNE